MKIREPGKCAVRIACIPSTTQRLLHMRRHSICSSSFNHKALESRLPAAGYFGVTHPVMVLNSPFSAFRKYIDIFPDLSFGP